MARVSQQAIIDAANKAGVDPDLYQRLIHQESGGQDLTSPKGARGPAQLMPATARGLGVDANDPQQNLEGGARYLRQQLDSFNGDPRLAAAAYNAGPGAVRRYGGVPPFPETQGYVRNVVGGVGSSVDQKSGFDGAALFAGLDNPQQGQPAQGGPSSGFDGAALFQTLEPKPAPKGHAGAGLGFGASGFAKPPQLPAPAPVTASGLAKSAGSGLVGSLLGMTQQVNPFDLHNVNNVIDQAAPASAALSELAGLPSAAANALPNALQNVRHALPFNLGDTTAEQQQRLGLSHTPQNFPEKVANLAGALAPAAVAGPGGWESIPRRLAQVAIPTATGIGVGALAKKVDPRLEGVGTMAGVLGGGFAAARLPSDSAPSLARPQELVPADVPNSVARRAAEYVGRQTSTIDPIALDASQGGDPITTAEMLGRNGQRAVGALARREGATGEMLNSVVNARSIDRPGRVMNAVADTAGVAPTEARGVIESLVAKGRADAGPLYEKAYSLSPPQNDALDAILQRPSAQKALSIASRLAAEEGRNPNTLGFQFDADGNVTHVQTPSMQTLDYVKRGLDDVLNGYRDTTTGRLNLDESGRAVLGTLRHFRDIVTSPNTPATAAYGDALGASGDYLSMQDAYQNAGKSLFNNRFPAQDYANRFSGLGDANQNGWRAGIANQIFDLQQAGRLKPGALLTPIVKAKLDATFGPSATQDLIRSLNSEQAMTAFERRYAPGAGSITSEMSGEMAAQDSLNPAAKVAIDTGMGAIRGGVRGAVSAGAGSVARQVGDWAKTAGMSIPVRDEAGRILTSQMTPAQLQDYLAAIAANKRPTLGIAPLAPAIAGTMRRPLMPPRRSTR